jgi:hypothetical protein
MFSVIMTCYAEYTSSGRFKVLAAELPGRSLISIWRAQLIVHGHLSLNADLELDRS